MIRNLNPRKVDKARAQDPIAADLHMQRRRLTEESHHFARAVNGAINRQAAVWGIRFEQAAALLLDRKKIA